MMLNDRIFSGWPRPPHTPDLEAITSYRCDFATLSEWKVNTDQGITFLPFFRLKATRTSGKEKKMVILDEANWTWWAPKLKAVFPEGQLWKNASPEPNAETLLKQELEGLEEIVLLCMRGAGPAAFSADVQELIKIKRRYYLLGQTLEGMQTSDLVHMLTVGAQDPGNRPIRIEAQGLTAGMLAYASIYFDPPAGIRIHLTDPPLSHQTGPIYPTILRYFDIPTGMLLAANSHPVTIHAHQASEIQQWKDLVQFSRSIPDIQLSITD